LAAASPKVDGIPVRSCKLAIGDLDVGNQHRGVGNSGDPHPVQAAWIAHQVAQCGYRQSGQIMQVVFF
jgi:isoquinoline 1-oxidoreductase alpha subunit